jgi:hypothetical protein
MKVGLVVKRHPEGYNYVAFDHDPHPSREGIVAAYIAGLVNEGHVVERVDGFAHRPDPHPLDFHLKLVSGPRA